MENHYVRFFPNRLVHTLLIALFCGLATYTASAQSFDFVTTAGLTPFSGEDAGQATVTDADGNVYVTGYFSSTATFGATTLTTAGTQDIFLAKYTAAGTLLWVRRAGGSGNDKGLGIAVDNSGIYITGFFQGTANFNTPSTSGSNELTSAGAADVFVAKYDAAGTVLWLQRAGGSDADEGRGIAVDNNGVYITGLFNGTADFNTPSNTGSNMLTSAGNTDIFVAQYTTSGAVQWIKRAGGSDADKGNGIAVYNNEVYVTGSFSGTANANTPSDPSSNTLISAGGTDIFVAKYDAAGVIGWFRRAGGSSADNGNGIAVDISGVYIIGDFQGTANFNTPFNAGSNNLNVQSGTDIFIAQYTLAGAVGWLRRAGGNNNEIGTGIVVYNNEVYVTGYFAGTVNFDSPSNTGNNTLIAVSFTDSFLAKYTSAGEAVWARRAGGTRHDRGMGITVNNNGVYSTGYFGRLADFNTPSNTGSNTLISAGDLDIFVAQYTTSGAVGWIKGNGGLEARGITSGEATTTDATGNIYVAGYFTGMAVFGTTTLRAASGEQEAFVAKYNPSGTLLWVRRAGGGNGVMSVNGIAVDNNAVYITGSFGGTVDFNNPSNLSSNTLTAEGESDIFVAKYDVAGTIQWVRRGGGSNDLFGDYGTGIAVYNNQVYVTGYIRSPLANFNTPSDPNSNTITKGVDADVVVVKYSSDGVLLWLRRAGGSSDDVSGSIAVDNSGVYIMGRFRNTGNFNIPSDPGSNTFISTVNQQTFLAKYTHEGVVQWLRRAGADGRWMALYNGDVYVTGQFGGVVDFNTPSDLSSNTLTATGSQDIFIAKYNSAGAVQWFRSVGRAGSSGIGYGIVATNRGCYVAGVFTNTIDFDTPAGTGSNTLTSVGGGDMFLASYDASGTVQWVRRAGGAGSEVISNAVTTYGNSIYVTGYFDGTINFNTPSAPGSNEVTSLSSRDMFLAKWSQLPTITGFAASPATVCPGSGTTFTATVGSVTGAYDFTLTNGTSTTTGTTSSSALSQSWTAAGVGVQSFTLTVSANSLSTNAVTSLTVGAMPSLTVTAASPDMPVGLTITQGNTVTLTASGADSYTWTGGTTGNTFTASPASTTVYSVTGTNAISGCTSVTSVTVTVNAIGCGAIIHVTESGSGLQDGSSWANSLPGTMLQAAITRAASCSAQVWVAAGIYKPTTLSGPGSRTASFSMRNNVAIYGGFVGNETVLTARPNPVLGQISSSTLSGEIGNPSSLTDNSYHVIYNFSSLNLDRSAIIDGFVITGGYGNDAVYQCPDYYGAGMYNDVASPTVNNCLFTRNNALSGGGMLNRRTNSTPSVGPLITNSVFTANVAEKGGGMFNLVSTVTLRNVIFKENYASSGGALYNRAIFSAAFVNTVFQSNTAANGGAIFNETSSSPQIINATFRDNQASVAGGALFNFTYNGNTTARLINCVLFNNGGGNTFYNSPPQFTSQLSSVSLTYSLAEPDALTATGVVISDPGNLTTTVSPFASTTSTELAACSPAINAGDPATTTALVGVTDLAGNARFFNNGVVDMGAYEFQRVGIPASFSVQGSGTATCASSPTITLSGSQTGVSYQLRRDGATTGSAVVGTGSALSFGPQSLSGTYTVLATSTSGCTAVMAQSATVVSNTVATSVSITPSSSTLSCASPTVSLSAIGAGTVLWSTGASTSVISVSVANTYSVTLTNANGCTATANATVSGTVLTSVAVTADGPIGCGRTTATVTIQGSGASSYTLLGPASYSQVSSTGVFVVTAGGSYTGLASQSGCVVSGTVTVSEGGVQPTAMNFRASGVLGSGSCSVQLLGTATGDRYTVTGADGYVFSNVYRTVGSRELAGFSVSKPGTYTLTVYSGSCSASYNTVVSGTACP